MTLTTLIERLVDSRNKKKCHHGYRRHIQKLAQVRQLKIARHKHFYTSTHLHGHDDDDDDDEDDDDDASVRCVMAHDMNDVGGLMSEERLIRGSNSGVDAFGRESNPYGSYGEGMNYYGGGGIGTQPRRNTEVLYATAVPAGGGAGAGGGGGGRGDSRSVGGGVPGTRGSRSPRGNERMSAPEYYSHVPATTTMSGQQLRHRQNPGGGGVTAAAAAAADDAVSYGASSRGWGPGAAASADAYVGSGGATYASAGPHRTAAATAMAGGGNPQDNPQAPLQPPLPPPMTAQSNAARWDHRGGGRALDDGDGDDGVGNSYAFSGPYGGGIGATTAAIGKARRYSNDKGPREDHVRHLMSQGFSTGLARALALNAVAFDHRVWVVDNSGSMQIGDGHRIVASNPSSSSSSSSKKGKKRSKDIRAVPSTRWEEIQDTVRYHSEMAALLDSPTIFKLLNDPGQHAGPQQFSVAHRGEAYASQDIQLAAETMRKAKPGGVTPLTRHIWEIQQSIEEMAPRLKREGKKIVVVLATDGLPTDEQGYGGEYITNEFIRALRSLEGLPVWLVVRLCTDEELVTRFYNNLDGQLELSLEVLDDFIAEAQEVYRHNKWLNYALPMHRCRELGYHDRLFDLIDERPLTKGEVRDFCALLFGVNGVDGLPDPGADWPGFIKAVQSLQKREQPQWNPIKKKMAPWVDVKLLKKSFADNSRCVVM